MDTSINDIVFVASANGVVLTGQFLVDSYMGSNYVYYPYVPLEPPEIPLKWSLQDGF